MGELLSAMAPELVEIEQRLQAKRGSDLCGKRIPEWLWLEPARIAIKFGVHRTKRWLGLDYCSLNKHVDPKPCGALIAVELIQRTVKTCPVATSW